MVILCLRGQPAVVRGDADGNVRTLYLDAPDHIQRDEVASDLRVPYVPQSLPDTSLGESVGRLWLPGRTVHKLFCRLGLGMPTNIVRWPGLTSAKPVNHV